MTTAIIALPDNPGFELPVFLDPSGRRQRLLEHMLIAVFVVGLLFLGTACYALA